MTELPPSDELTAEQANAVQINCIRGGDLLVWAVYNSPTDHPGKFIARPYSIRRQVALRCHLTADSLDQIRRLLPPGVVRLDRNSDDDPKIVETWV